MSEQSPSAECFSLGALLMGTVDRMKEFVYGEHALDENSMYGSDREHIADVIPRIIELSEMGVQKCGKQPELEQYARRVRAIAINGDRSDIEDITDAFIDEIVGIGDYGSFYGKLNTD